MSSRSVADEPATRHRGVVGRRLIGKTCSRVSNPVAPVRHHAEAATTAARNPKGTT